MVPVWMSPPPRDVAAQTQQRTTAEIFQFRHGTYFSQIVELFRVFVPRCMKSAVDRHRRDDVSTRNGRKPDTVRPCGVSQKFFVRPGSTFASSRRCDPV